MTRPKGCGICGGFETVEATDNYGKRYVGCAKCRILSAAEIARLTEDESGPFYLRLGDGSQILCNPAGFRGPQWWHKNECRLAWGSLSEARKQADKFANDGFLGVSVCRIIPASDERFVTVYEPAKSAATVEKS